MLAGSVPVVLAIEHQVASDMSQRTMRAMGNLKTYLKRECLAASHFSNNDLRVVILVNTSKPASAGSSPVCLLNDSLFER